MLRATISRVWFTRLHLNSVCSVNKLLGRVLEKEMDK
jgi:hypothetical protein